jgi:AcrR family transcriptional regulator
MSPVEAGSGLRERKKERTHEAIRDAALDLFRDKGYEGTTVDDIAAAADVSPRTFFRYYANKEEVLFSKFDETLELLRDFLYGFPAEVTVGQALRAALNEFAAVGSVVSADRATFDVFRSNEHLQARYLMSFFRLEQIAAEWIASRAGVPADDFLPRTLAAVLASGARVALDVWVEQPGRELQHLLETTLAMIESALRD